MRPYARRICISTVALVAFANGCNQKDNSKGNFSAALDGYFAAHPECLWTEPQKLPAQSDTTGGSDTSKYDALVDAGLLTRTSAEKQKLIILTKQVNLYDLSTNGRAAWTADPGQPGYGNFCYGHRKVQEIAGFNPAGTQPGATTSVTYTWRVADAAGWAKAAETQTAFPALATAIGGPNTAQANLVLTTDGWKVQAPAAAARTNRVGGDSGIVQ